MRALVKFVWFGLFLAGLISVTAISISEGASNQSQGRGPQIETARSEQILTTLRAVIDTRKQLATQLKEAEDRSRSVTEGGPKEKIDKEISVLSAKMAESKSHFEEIATGVDLSRFEAEPRQEFNWTDELKDILGPIIQELRGLTARPRELDRLRREEDYLQRRLSAINQGLSNINQLKASLTTTGVGPETVSDAALLEELQALQSEWLALQQQTTSKLAVIGHQLEEKLAQKKSVFETVHHIFALFFKSRGRNLLLALVASVAVFFLFRYGHRLIYLYGPLAKKKERSIYVRVGDVVYYAATFLAVSTTFLIILYLYGDWVLLGLSFIFLFGLAWAARHGLAHFWRQTQLLLNIGPVRENERVLVGGIPWKVLSINLYTELINPALTGGRIRLPLKDLVDLRSRPMASNEPWFPCREGDWVILADGAKGKVLVQTPETVEVVLLGGSHRYYRTADFLDQSPLNISVGFRLNIVFGIDYQHQRLSTTEIPEKLDQILIEGLKERGYGNGLINLRVEFKEAGSSSLDLEILADFSGSLAPQHEILSRLLQRLAVDACNRYNWVIPFTQLTIHQAPSSVERPGKQADPPRKNNFRE